MSRIRAAVFALILPALASGALSSVRAAEPSRAKKDCINKREINVMRPLDEKHVFVKAGANHNYLFTTEGRCHGLRLARRLSIWEGSTRVCADGSSLLAFSDPTVGDMRCRIANIESVKDLAAAMEMLDAEVPPR